MLPTLLRQKTEVYISLSKNKHNVYSQYFDEKVSFNNLAKSSNSHWIDYIKGCLAILKINKYLKNDFFNILIFSNIPINKGISSSAAICVALLKAIRNYYDLIITDKEIALLAQKVEKQYIGVKCGIMDQMVSSIGILNKAFFLNCRTLEYELIDIPKDYIFNLIDTKIERNLRASSYNQRYKELKKAEKFLKPKKLFESSLADLNKNNFDDLIKKRARHVITENIRVLQARKALKDNELNYFGKLMNKSHSSYSKDFEASNKEIDLMVKRSILSGSIGSRLTGGGFGGFVVSLVNINKHKKWKTNMSKIYNKKQFFLKLKFN